jgi:hypothetical protein
VIKAILLDTEARDPNSFMRLLGGDSSNYGALKEPVLFLAQTALGLIMQDIRR